MLRTEVRLAELPGHPRLGAVLQASMPAQAGRRADRHAIRTGRAGAATPACQAGFGLIDLNVEAEALGYCSSFLVEHHFSGWNQVSATLTLLTCLAMRTTTLRRRQLGDGAALAPSGAARRAGRDARRDVGRPARFRHRQGLPLQRVHGLQHPAGGGRRALRGGARGHHPAPGRRASASRTTASSGPSTTSWSSRRRRRSRIRRSGSRPAASRRSGAPRRAASG